MTPSGEIIIEKASVDDAEEILALQKLAYVSEAEIIDDFTIPPLHQTLEAILSEFNYQIFLKSELENRIIGSARCYFRKGTCYIGKLIVHPDHQNQGIGTQLLLAAENQYPYAKRYELFTGHRSEKNLHLYKKHGYTLFKIEVVSDTLTLVFLEKFNRKI